MMDQSERLQLPFLGNLRGLSSFPAVDDQREVLVHGHQHSIVTVSIKVHVLATK